MKAVNIENKIDYQLRSLFGIEFLRGFRMAGSVWVFLLMLRGFSLSQICIAVAVYYLAALWVGVPARMLRSSLGSKYTIVTSNAFLILAAVVMALSSGIALACVSLIICAFALKLSGSSLTFITHASLKDAGRESEYGLMSSLQRALCTGGRGLAVLCAGFTASLGFKVAYMIDAFTAFICVLLALSLFESESAKQDERQKLDIKSVPRNIVDERNSVLAFLRRNSRITAGVIIKSAVKAGAVFLALLLQYILINAGASNALLGLLLLIFVAAGAIGARLARPLEKLPYRAVQAVCIIFVVLGMLAPLTGSVPVMTAFGALAVMSGVAYQAPAEKKLTESVTADDTAALHSAYDVMFNSLACVFALIAALIAAF